MAQSDLLASHTDMWEKGREEMHDPGPAGVPTRLLPDASLQPSLVDKAELLLALRSIHVQG